MIINDYINMLQNMYKMQWRFKITEGRIIYNPSESVMKMFYRKMNAESREELKSRKFDAVGLLQTTVAGVLYYADRAFKTSNVFPVEINGSCPQHITTLAFFGETTAVETAMKTLMREEKEKKNRLIQFLLFSSLTG